VLTPSYANIGSIPARYANDLEQMLSHPRQLDPTLLAGGQIITDARSTVARDIARTQMNYRLQIARELPPAFLLN
jgi:hypothetical protein